MNNTKQPWCHIDINTLDEVMERLYYAVNRLCSCGGSGPYEEGECDACKIWHYVTGNRITIGK